MNRDKGQEKGNMTMSWKQRFDQFNHIFLKSILILDVDFVSQQRVISHLMKFYLMKKMSNLLNLQQ